MGLDVSNDAWHGAYSAFNRWRDGIASTAGYENRRVKYENGEEWDTIMLDWGHIPKGALWGEWDEMPSDPLHIIFAHSDCDGHINHEHAGPLADRLEELLPKLEKMDDDQGHIGNWVSKTKEFIAGCRLAVIDKENLEFR